VVHGVPVHLIDVHCKDVAHLTSIFGKEAVKLHGLTVGKVDGHPNGKVGNPCYPPFVFVSS